YLLPHYTHHRSLHSFPTRRSSDLYQRETAQQRLQVLDRVDAPDPGDRRDCRLRGEGREILWIDSVVDGLDRGRMRAEPPLPACRSEEHTSELQSRFDLVCRLLLEK